MGHASQEIFVAARPSFFTLVRIRESVNRALDDVDPCEIFGTGPEWPPNSSQRLLRLRLARPASTIVFWRF